MRTCIDTRKALEPVCRACRRRGGWGATLMVALAGWVALAGCIRDERVVCPPLEIRLGVTDKNYENIRAAARLGLEEAMPEDAPFRVYVKDLTYRLTCLETGEVVCERELAEVTGDERVLTIAADPELPFGTYVLTAWGNADPDAPAFFKEATGGASAAVLHPGAKEGTDLYLACDTLVYDELSYQYSVGMRRAKGKLIVQVEEMPDAYGFSEKWVSDIRERVDQSLAYEGALTIPSAVRWPHPYGIVTKRLLAPSEAPDASRVNFRFYVGDTAEGNDNWIAPEEVSVTLSRNRLTILRYVYDACCCRFKIYILINDNWETLHIMDVV